MNPITAPDRVWTVSRMPDLTGKTIVVTGANSGIGLEASRVFAAKGAHVVLAVRDEAKGHRAAATLEGSTEVLPLDLADLSSVRSFAERWSGDIDVLVNNAGILVPPFALTADGFELQIGTNHLGHFALTNLLLPHITGRVVTVASNSHRTGALDFDDLNWTTRKYSRPRAYADSKLANLLFSFELQRRLSEDGSPVRSMAVHPGWAATNLGATSFSPLTRVGISILNRIVAQDAVTAATPTLFAATEPIPGGSYTGPSGRREMAGPPALTTPAAHASDPVAAARLWTLSEELTGISFPLRTRSLQNMNRAGSQR